MRNLEKIKKVRFNNFSQYNAGRSNTGGAYGYWTDYTRVEGGWEVSHETTADFAYCPCCGLFGDHFDWDEMEWSCGGFDVISTEELEKEILSFENEYSEDDGYTIEYLKS